MKAIILAGGEGTRLRPITYEIPKPLIPVKKKPVITHIINFFNKHGIFDIGIIISGAHQEDFKIWRDVWHKNIFSQLIFFITKEGSGTFSCLRVTKDWIGNEDFIVCNGDTLVDFYLPSLVKLHKRNISIATMALVQSNTYGSADVPRLGEKNKVKGLERKNIEPMSDFINSGFCIFKPEIFNYDELNLEFLDREKDIFPKLIKDDAIIAIKMDQGRLFDVGTIESWEKAIKEW